ncbi:YtxH domain-containing protein [Bacillus sp. FJAT-45350]|uniref:YtxH domain-containing protein n=1 Tax=Bacillus sp. FJAT-45350 TaxID=2011014 RepID=UPI000BB8FD65|nr:hypothetical protein [Bacillus sp. FJAT-45350]
MDKKTCNTIYKGMVIGGIIGAVALFANSTSRKKLLNGAKEFKETTSEVALFIKDHRHELFDQIKETSKEISTVVRDVSDDIKKLTESAVHIKESSSEIIKVTKEAADELKHLK